MAGYLEMNGNYVVATVKPWNIRAYRRRCKLLGGRWTLLETPEELTHRALSLLKPEYVFFPHWSWRVTDEIIRDFNCVCFHETDLPYGRGGSPIQNLITAGHKETQISALRMVQELDAGPIYLKRPLSLMGSAQEIFERAAEVIFDMIDEIISRNPAPVSQAGQPVLFTRRTPAQSRLPAVASPLTLYDHIRMLDAETYPAAFLDFEGWHIEFRQARLDGNCVEAIVSIRPAPKDSDL
jgi:methionyl-tRNA formyltransferase